MMTQKGRELICEDIASRHGDQIMADIDRLCGDAHCVSFALLISPAGEKTHLVSNMCRSCLETNFGFAARGRARWFAARAGGRDCGACVI